MISLPLGDGVTIVIVLAVVVFIVVVVVDIAANVVVCLSLFLL